MTLTLGILARLEAKPGKGDDLAAFRKHLRALLTVRTGRVEASKHFLNDRDADLLSIAPRPRVMALLGGTAVSLLVPWISSDPQIPFENE